MNVVSHSGPAPSYGVILVRVELPPHSDRPGAQAPPSASAPAPLFYNVVTMQSRCICCGGDWFATGH